MELFEFRSWCGISLSTGSYLAAGGICQVHEVKMRRMLFSCILLALLPLTILHAEPRVFTVTVHRVMGERETRDQIRELATLEAKRRVLEQAGMYLRTETVVRNYQMESEEIIALAAGVLSTEQTEESWGMEGMSIYVDLTYRVTIDPLDVNNRIEEIRQDPEKMADFERIARENEQLRAQMESLREEMEEAESARMQELEELRARLSERYSAREWFQRGVEARDVQEQIEHYTHAISIDSAYSEAYNNRAVAYRRLGDYDQALADYTMAIQHDSTYLAAITNRGVAYYRIGDYEHALEDQSMAIAFDSTYYTAYNNRGVIYHQLGEYEEAIADYTLALRYKENFLDAINNRGVAYHAMREYERAIEDYTRVLEYNPNVSSVYYNRGISYLSLGDSVNARSDFERALELGLAQARDQLDLMDQ